VQGLTLRVHELIWRKSFGRWAAIMNG
jgi:hypothetical protein